MYRYATRETWDTESENKAKETIARQFNGYDNFVVICDEKHKVIASKNGVEIEVNFDSIGYNNYSIDINVNSGYQRSEYKTIGRITPKTDLYAPRFVREFSDYANRRIDEKLYEQITRPALSKSHSNSEKAFVKWEKANAEYTKHESVSEVKVNEDGYRIKTANAIGTDSIITNINTRANIPNIDQLFRIIVQSGIKVEKTEGGHIYVIGNGEETTNFLKLLNSPLEWN